MWTNIFKISGLQQISWFQFLPQEFDFNVLADKSHKLDQNDAAMLAVLSAHLQLQKEGFLSSWTNYFVGPWDPSQGLHNPDEKIKLWLFLPGQHSSVIEKAQAAVSKLRILASGIWVSPGDSEEFASAFSQALRNCIERALRGLSYVRFGDAFSKYHPLMQNEEPFRRGEPVAEFIFSATEELIFVHVIISAKNVRALSSSDIKPFFSSSTRHSNERISVVVSPHGMLGKLTGYCPGDLVNQVYLGSGKVRGPNELVGLSHNVAQGSGVSGEPRGQNCFVEVTLGGLRTIQKNVNAHSNSPDKLPVYEKLFVYPSEAVLVPLMRTCFARSSLKRFWLQNWVGPSLSGSALIVNCDDKIALRAGSLDRNGTRSGYGYHSSSNSNSSSNCSMSSSSADGDHKIVESGDLVADADSLMTRQSGLSSLDPVQSDGPQLGSKRPRAGNSESCGQAGIVPNPAINDYCTTEANDSGSANEQTDTRWGWDDDDKDMGMDIQELLSEFGDFGDFFENDALPFGEPPGSEQSQALTFHAPESGELAKSPGSSMMDVSDQVLLTSGHSSFDNINQLQASATFEDLPSKIQEVTKTSVSGKTIKELPFYNVEFDLIVKAEAEMTFAPSYGAVEAPVSDNTSAIFRSPYTPKDYKVDCVSSSNGYVYSATPPSSPGFAGRDKKPVVPASLKSWKERSNSKAALKSSKHYTYIDKGKQPVVGTQNYLSGSEVMVAASQFSGFGQHDAKSLSNKVEGSLGGDNFLTSLRNGIASQIECLVCQASMCRLRHNIMPSRNLLPSGTSGFSVNSNTNQSRDDLDSNSGKFELKKKETVPVRIAGDTDKRILDGPLNAAVGVWRSVGIPKINKTSNLTMEVASLPHNSFIEESMLPYGQQQPLQELLDGIVLLVQQAASFVDLALDADCGDGPFGLLALEEQSRRGLSCGPSMTHAGCGGLLASCHSLDVAGIELADPLSVDVQASLTLSLLQSDIKTALKSAFSSVEGPLYVADWCRGRNLANEAGVSCEGLSLESTASASDCRDSSVTGNFSAGEPRSPSLSSASGAPYGRDGIRGDEPVTPTLELDQQKFSWFRPTLTVVPFPSILVGYQDDWLKTASSSLQIWEKAPLEPYATQKHMSYCVVCPNIDPLITAAADFFLQLGTVYETCKLGTHSPQSPGNEMEVDSGKISTPGFVLLDCPQSMKIDASNASMLGLISDYFLCLSNGWDLTSYLKTLSKVLRTLKFGSAMTQGAKEGNGGPCTVVYVVCPFPEPLAILQTVVESSIAIGSVIRSSSREKRSMVYNQVAKALSYSVAADESFSNVLTLTGFCIPKLVLQIVTVDAVFRVTSPRLSELVVLKEIAFTVYNKARRIMRGASGETNPSLSVPGRSNAVVMQMPSPVSGMWKDIVGPQIGGQPHQRESELDSSLRPGSWDNSWQMTRSSGLGSDSNRNGDALQLDDARCLFEPLYILAEPGSLERGQSHFSYNATESSKILSDDCTSSSFPQTSASSGGGDNGPTPHNESPDSDATGSSHKKSFPSLHCCYGWTEDWRWLVCVWTDSRGELLDCYVYPFGGVSSRQDTMGLQSLFIQILQQGCHILQACSPEVKPREFVITRIGTFFELECQEWQKALYAAGSSDVKKWSLQLRRSLTDGMFSSSNGNPLQPQDMNLMQDRVLPSSPNPMYGPHLKASTFIKGGIAQASSRKLMGGSAVFDNSKGLLQWIQSISFVSVSIDHSLQLICQSDLVSSGTISTSAPSNYIEGYTPVKSLGSTAASYIMIPSPNMRFLPHTTLQLPTCLTADSPPLAHLLHSKGSAIPLCTGFVVSKAVPSVRSENRRPSKEEWPSVLSISLVDYYGGSTFNQEKSTKTSKRGINSEPKDVKFECHLILEPIAAELHALSWMTVSPAYMDRRTALPFHCDMVLRVRRLLHFADKLLSRPPEKAQL